MSRPARDFLVYSCRSCSRRIFTERSHAGRTGVCPCCGAKHTVGGVRIALEADERRAAPRVRDEGARLSLAGAAQAGELLHEELFALGDISETGVSFKMAGLPDARQLSGVRPPLEVGDSIQLTLHSPQQLGPRTYRAVIRRIVTGGLGARGTYTIGAEFVGLSPKQEAELKALVERLSPE